MGRHKASEMRELKFTFSYAYENEPELYAAAKTNRAMNALARYFLERMIAEKMAESAENKAE